MSAETAAGLLPWLVPVLALLTLGAAAAPVVGLLRARPGGAGDALLTLAAAASFFALVFAGGFWLFTSRHLRYAFLGLLAAAAWRAWRRTGEGEGSGRSGARAVVAASVLAVSSSGLGLLGYGHTTPPGAVEMTLPLRHGRFAVLQGGRGGLVNFFHRGSPRESYAIDFVELSPWGNRVSGVPRIRPGDVGAYRIHGEAVAAPCTGPVVGAVDDLPDNAPGHPDPRHPEGNHVVLECGAPDGGAVRVLLAHLLAGSVRVEPDDRVRTGTVLARVGNSGNSSEPHLHLSAWRSGPDAPSDPRERAVPLAFGGRFLALGDVVESVELLVTARKFDHLQCLPAFPSRCR